MSCDVAMAAYLFLASASPSGAPAQTVPAVAAPGPVSAEPLFIDIVSRATKLKVMTDAYGKTAGLKALPAAKPLPGFTRFESEVAELAALDMKGHLELAARGTDGDLKCILRGISQDLPRKLDELEKAPSGAAQYEALRDMSYLLNDNVEVITAPPAPPA